MNHLLKALILVLFLSCSQNLPQKDNWALEDYASFAEEISTLKFKKLPTIKKHPHVFKGFISSFNQPTLLDQSLDINQRMEKNIDLMDDWIILFNKYTNDRSDDRKYPEELAHITGLGLSVSHYSLINIKEFMLTLDNTTPKYQVRVSGYKQMQLGYFQQVHGAILTVIQKKHFYDDEVNLMFAQYALTALKNIPFELNDSYRNTLSRTTQRVINNKPTEEIKVILQEIINSLK